MKIHTIMIGMAVILLTMCADAPRAWAEKADAAAMAPSCGNGILESFSPYNEECDPATNPRFNNDPVPCADSNLICTSECKCIMRAITTLRPMPATHFALTTGDNSGTDASGVAGCGDGVLTLPEQCSVSGERGSEPTEKVTSDTIIYEDGKSRVYVGDRFGTAATTTTKVVQYHDCPVGYYCEHCACYSDDPNSTGEVYNPFPGQSVCGNRIFDEGEECGEIDEALNELKCEDPEAQCVNCKCVAVETCGNGDVEKDLGEECDIATDPSETFKRCNGLKDTMNLGYLCTDDCKCSLCGNGTFESVAQVGEEAGEECDFNEGAVGIQRHCKYTKGTEGIQYGCNDECKCITCGNGIVDTDLGEQCDLDANGVLLAGSLCKENEYCDACKCYEQPGDLCHDGKLDPGEECDSDGTVADGTWATDAEEQASADAKCAAGQSCVANCTCQSEGTPISTTPVPIAKTCTVKITGASSDAAQEYINDLNAKVHEIIGTDAIDIFGEIGYSVASVNIQFADTSAPSSVKLASSVPKIAVGDTNVGAWALLQLGGTPPYDYSKDHFLPALASIKEPMIIFPIGAEPEGAKVAKAIGLKEVVYPNLSSVAGLESVTLNDVVGVMGSENVDFTQASQTAMKVNNFVRWEVKPAVTASSKSAVVTDSSGLMGLGGTIQEGEFRMPWDWPNFTGVEGFKVPEGMKPEDMYIENRQMDINLVLEDLAKRAAEWKSGGRDISCDIAAELPYEANLNMQFMAVQNKVTEGGGVDTQGFAGLAVIGELARGGGCGGHCSIIASVPPVSHLALFLGVATAGLGSIVAVRRKRRK